MYTSTGMRPKPWAPSLAEVPPDQATVMLLVTCIPCEPLTPAFSSSLGLSLNNKDQGCL